MIRPVGFGAVLTALLSSSALSAPIINAAADRAAFQSGQGANLVQTFDFDGEVSDRAFSPSEIPNLTFSSADSGFNPRIDTFGGATPFLYDDPINNPGNVPSNRPVRIDLAADVEAIGFSWATDFDTRVDGGLNVEVVNSAGTVLNSLTLGGASVDQSFFPDDLPGGSGFDNFATITGLRDLADDAVAILLTPTGTGIDQSSEGADFVALDNIVVSNFQDVPRSELNVGPVLVGRTGTETEQISSGSGRVPNAFEDDGDGQFDVGSGKGVFDTAGGPHEFEVEFSPEIRTEITPANGVLAIEDQDGNPIQYFDVTGTAVAPVAEVSVEYVTQPFFQNPLLPPPPTLELKLSEDQYAESRGEDATRQIINLGFLRVGQEIDLDFIISNIGDGNLADLDLGDLFGNLTGAGSNDVFRLTSLGSSFQLRDATDAGGAQDQSITLTFGINSTLNPFTLSDFQSTEVDLFFANGSPDGTNDNAYALFDIQANFITGFFGLTGFGLEAPPAPNRGPKDGVINVNTQVEGFTLDDEQNFSLEVTNEPLGSAPPDFNGGGSEDSLRDLFVQGMDGSQTDPDPLTLTLLSANIAGDDADNADVLGVSGYRILDELGEEISSVLFDTPREEDILEGGEIALLPEWSVVFDFAFNLSSGDFASVVAGGLDLRLDLVTDFGASAVGLEGNTLSIGLDFTAIPGPGAFALLGPALGALLWRRRKA